MMRRMVLVAVVFCGLISCTKGIDELEKSEIAYQELPINVKDNVFDSDTNGNLQYEDLNDEKKYDYYKELNNPKKYKYFTEQKTFFPWIYEGFIKNITTEKVYSVGSKKSVNYIIYGDSLYIPNDYNLYAKDSLTYTFTRYILK